MKTIKHLLFLIVTITTLNNYAQCSSKIISGAYHNCIQKTDGSLFVFGSGTYGELGNSSDTNEYTPISLTANTNWQQIVCGTQITLAINSNGTLWGTGFNLYGGLGIGSMIDHLSVLTQIGTATNWKQIASDANFTIALKTDNSLWGWGQNDGYQMGDGSCCANRLAPATIGTATDWKMVAVSHARSAFAIKNNGTLWCWGSNIAALLGDNLVTGRAFPTQHNTATDWASITLGVAHMLALKTNGTLWSWGDGGHGETGDGLPANYNRFTPLQIGTSTWKAVAGGLNTSYGIKTDGTLWAWGLNDVGQLGLGNTTNQPFPVQIGTDTNWDKVTAGYQGAIALKTNGSLWAWGDNSAGQYGNGTTVSSTTPVYIPIAGCTLANEQFALGSNGLLLSPNPSKNRVTITYYTHNENSTLEVCSILGKKIADYKAVSGSGSWELNTSNLAAGVYTVVMRENNLVLMQKKLIVE